MNKKIIGMCSGLLAVTFASMLFVGGNKTDWKTRYDTSLPDLNSGSWKETLHTDFTKIGNMEQLLAANWAPSPHVKRNVEYWCDDMLEFTENGLIVHSEQRNNHNCDVCGVSEGIFTGGIETRRMADEKSEVLFAQAYGYFEATVIVSRGTGMWSAFWLQSDGTGKIGNQGRDGSEIDVYESSFMAGTPTKTGQAIHYDAYNAPWYRSKGNVTDVGYNLYDGLPHTYALKWTPNEYVMYVDGTPVWATDYGGVSQVPEFLRLTVEIRPNQWGPYAQKLGDFVNHTDGTNDFVIQDVKVYQNTEYEKSARTDADFKDKKNLYKGLLIGGSTAAAALGAAAIGFAAKAIYKARKRKLGNQ